MFVSKDSLMQAWSYAAYSRGIVMWACCPYCNDYLQLNSGHTLILLLLLLPAQGLAGGS
jgi:hypothetical protein